MGTGLEVVLIGAAVGGTVASIQQSRKAAKAQRRAAEAQQKIQEVKAARERAQLARQARVARARAAASAAGAGALDTSSFVGGQSSIQGQLGSNLNFLNTVVDLNSQVTGFQNQALAAQTRASNFQAISNLALQGASMFGTPGAPTKATSTTPRPGDTLA